MADSTVTGGSTTPSGTTQTTETSRRWFSRKKTLPTQEPVTNTNPQDIIINGIAYTRSGAGVASTGTPSQTAPIGTDVNATQRTQPQTPHTQETYSNYNPDSGTNDSRWLGTIGAGLLFGNLCLQSGAGASLLCIASTLGAVGVCSLASRYGGQASGYISGYRTAEEEICGPPDKFSRVRSWFSTRRKD